MRIYVSVVPSASGFGQKLASQIDGQNVGATVGDTVSKGFLSKVGSLAGGTAKILGGVIGGAATAIGGIALGKGLSRALDIQDAQKKLEGLGHSATDVTKIMGNALDSVRGTAFGLGDAATVAASAVAAGIKPGAELTKYLKLTADSATIAGTSLGDMGQILNSVNANGTVYTGTLNQLSDRGIPVFQYLAKQYGVTQDALSKMVSKGQVDAATLDKVLEQHLAGSALKSGETARGAFANVGAALGRLGVQFGAGAAVTAAPALFTAMSSAVDRAAAAFAPFSDQVNALVTGGLTKLTAYINGIDFDQVAAGAQTVVTKIQGIIGQIQAGDFSSIGAGLGGSIGSIVQIVGAAGPVLQAFAAGFGSISGAVGQVLASGLPLLVPILNSLAGILGFLGDNTALITPLILTLAAGFAVYRAAQAAANVASLAALPIEAARVTAMVASAAANFALADAIAVATGQEKLSLLARLPATAQLIAQTAAKIAAAVATGTLSVVTGAATAAQWLFNAALTANPIGIIIVAIAAVVAALIFFFTQTKLGQQVWAGFVTFLTNAWNSIVQVAQTVFGAVVGFVQKYGLLILAAVAPVIGIPILIATHWGQITKTVSTVFGDVLKIMGSVNTLIFNAGKAIIQNFIDGITSMISKVGDAIGNVMSFVADFFPHSPAKRGEFSGSGWAQVGASGAALADQFSSGFQTNLNVSPLNTSGINTGTTTLPSTVTAASSSSGAAQPIYTDHGVLFGMIQQGADGVARLLLNQQNAAEDTTQRLGYQPLVFG